MSSRENSQKNWRCGWVMAMLLLVGAVFVQAEDGSASLYLEAGDTKRLVQNEGKVVVVYGRISSTEALESGTNLLHFEGAALSLVVFKSDLEAFPEGLPFELYRDKRLAVEGLLAVQRGEPQIKLVSAQQVTILREDQVFPPAEKAAETTPGQKSPQADPDPGMARSEEGDAEETAAPQPPVDARLYFRSGKEID